MRAHVQIAMIAGIAVPVTVLHYLVNPHEGTVHDILQRVYYLPIVLAGLWFGVRGGLMTALAISVIYFPHAFHGWSGPHSLFFRMSEITMYHVIGGLTGFLSSRVNNAFKAEQGARREREAAYERLREKTRELFQVEEQLRRSERLAAIGHLSAGLAHEIRNPLASIRTSLEILREREQQARAGAGASTTAVTGQAAVGSLDKESGRNAPDFHAILLEETDRLNRILTHFLEFARAEIEKDAGEPATGRLAEALGKTADLLAAQCAKHAVVIEYNPAELDLVVMVGESALRQVFLNLILNSLDAMPDGGTVRIVAVDRGSAPGRLTLVVEDTGPGIPPAVAPRIFDPFYSTKPNGTGLGLSIVERILTTYGGTIALDTATLPSSRFRLTLPLAETRD